jgi:hypothetical protein
MIVAQRGLLSGIEMDLKTTIGNNANNTRCTPHFHVVPSFCARSASDISFTVLLSQRNHMFVQQSTFLSLFTLLYNLLPSLYHHHHPLKDIQYIFLNDKVVVCRFAYEQTRVHVVSLETVGVFDHCGTKHLNLDPIRRKRKRIDLLPSPV